MKQSINRPSTQKLELGFTLIEVMIVVVVIAILMAVALPSYTTYIRQSRISEATGQLSTMRVQLEQYYQDNKNYASSACTLGTVTYGNDFSFACSLPGGDSQTFLLTATGTGSMVGFAFTIDHNNSRQTTAFPNVSTPINCWIRKASDSC